MTDDILDKLGSINAKVKQLGVKSAHKQYCYGNFVSNPSAKVMFVAEMPTPDPQWCPRCNFNISWTDRKFQEILIQHGFGGSYVTDIVKECAHSRRPTVQEIEKYRDILLEEISVVNPKLVVALGGSAFAILRDQFTLGDRLYRDFLYHPSVWQYPNKRDEYVKRIEALADYSNSFRS